MFITDFVVCDDIRFEQGGKISLMGVYEDNINFVVDPSSKNNWPKNLTFGFFCRCVFDKEDIDKGIASVGIIIELESDRVVDLPKIDLSIEMGSNERPTRIAFAPKINNMKIPGPGALSFSIRGYDAKGNEICKATPNAPVLINEEIAEDSL